MLILQHNNKPEVVFEDSESVRIISNWVTKQSKGEPVSFRRRVRLCF